MAKLTLNAIGSRYGSIDALNDNFDAIEQALENTLSRDGTSPNAMEADLDMNGNQILNASTINASTLIIGGQTLEPGDAVASATVQVFEFTATAGQTSFSVSPLTPAASSVLMEVNGLSLPTSSLVTSGSTLSFPALSLNDEVVVKVFTKEIGAYPAITNNEVAANAAIVSSKLAFTQAGTTQVRSVQDKLRDVVSVKDFGAVGDGITDDTLAFTNALTAALRVVIPAGATYVISGVSTTVANQSIEAYGATIKLKAATNSPIVILAHTGCKVRGGVFDGNSSNQSGTGSNQYSHAAISIRANDCSVQDILSQNSFGLGIRTGNNAQRFDISRNRIVGAPITGIYGETNTVISYGGMICNNSVDVSATSTAMGILFAEASASYYFDELTISSNHCVGSVVGTTNTVGITTQTTGSCVVSGNTVLGFGMGISLDRSQKTVAYGNVCKGQGVSAGATYGIEYNGPYCTISGNFCQGQTYGIIGSNSGTYTLNNTQIIGNTIVSPISAGIYMQVQSPTYNGRSLTISGNSINIAVASTATGIYLSGDCKYSNIVGNTINGGGSGIGTVSAILLESGTTVGIPDTLNISGNKITGFHAGLGLFAASGSQTYNRVNFNGNDLSQDVTTNYGATTGFVYVAGGSVTLGSNFSQMWNIGSTQGLRYNWVDTANGVQFIFTPNGNPNGALAAGPGSLCLNTVGGAGTTLYVKEATTVSSVWAAK